MSEGADKADLRGSFQRSVFLGAPFDELTFDQVLRLLESSNAGDNFRYVVTPNVDHVVKMDRYKNICKYYEGSWLSLCDSKPIFTLSQAFSLDLSHVTGADLTGALFESVIEQSDCIALIAADAQIVTEIRRKFPHVNFSAHVPPMNLAADPEAFQKCVEFATTGRYRFLFIALGSPHSERIAFEVSRNPESRGVGLCIGASLAFLVGTKTRAPRWMRELGLEWFHRLALEPGRLWRRYLYSFLPLIRLFLVEVRNPPNGIGMKISRLL